MGVELLILAQDRPGWRKKGHIITIQQDGHQWGRKELLPNFIQVRITDATVEQTVKYLQRWKTEFDYEVIGRNVALDGYRIRLWCANASVSNKNVITRNQVERFLNEWGASFVSGASNEVVFDFSIYGCATSDRFWNNKAKDVVFNEISYNQDTGEHEIEADYSQSDLVNIKPEKIEGLINEMDRDTNQIISHKNNVIRFIITRKIVTKELKEDIIDQLNSVYEERIFYLAPAAVDNVVSQGGRIETDKATFLNYIRSRLDD